MSKPKDDIVGNSVPNDRNFDDLVTRFAHNIYGGLKGKIRQAVVLNDIDAAAIAPDSRAHSGAPALRVFDAGGGLGAFSILMAQRGHQVTYCDLSDSMRQAAMEAAAAQGVTTISFQQGAFQQHFDLIAGSQVVLLHAVLEWLENPREALERLISTLQDGAKLSLLFYNKNSVVYRNLIRGNFYRAMAPDQGGHKGSLTPTNPLDPEDVKCWLEAMQVSILQESGVRVFYDYREKDRMSQRTDEQIIHTELAFSKHPAFRAVGRYYHLIIEK